MIASEFSTEVAKATKPLCVPGLSLDRVPFAQERDGGRVEEMADYNVNIYQKVEK